MVRQHHRLRALQVRVAGEVGVAGVLGPAHQHLLQRGDALDLLARPARRRNRRRSSGDLVVAAAAGVQLGARGPGELGDPPLDRGVDVLVGRDERERTRVELGPDPVERGDDQRRARPR